MWFFRRKKPVNSLPDRDEHLTGYIFKHYFHLLTTDEQNAWLSMVREKRLDLVEVF